jgi:hypothetical protein
VYFTIPERELGKVDIVISIYRDNRQRMSSPKRERVKGKIGDLHLSKGGVDWYRKATKTKVTIRWGQLARLIDSGSE